MDYDYRNRTASAYRPAGGSSVSMYPRVGSAVAPPAVRAPPYHQQAPPASSGLGIRVAIKPEYRINPPPQLAPQVAEVPRCNFQFDFEFERRILAEAEKGNQNWSKVVMESQPSKLASSASLSLTGDPLLDKYVSEGLLPHEAASLAVSTYGDNPVKVREFVKGYNLLREMGFASKKIAEVLSMYDNDTGKAITHFLNSSS